jgi:hypothetical protein
MEYFHSHNLGNVNSYEDIVKTIKDMNKYDKLFIVNDDPNYTTAIYDLGDSASKKITKKQFTFHLPPYKKVCNNTKGQICTICQDEMEENEYYRKLCHCGHCFHKKCVDEWFYKSASYVCPLCRKNPMSLEK